MTAAQYFDELVFCLNQLPAQERDEAVNFYREYAQEAGLSSYEQLVQRFGVPKILAARICAGDTERPSLSQQPKAKWRNPKMISWGVAGLLVVCLLIFAFGSVFVHTASSSERADRADLPTSNTSNVRPPDSDSTNPAGTLNDLAAFSRIDISVICANVNIVTGDTFSVSYRLHENEVLDCAEVKNDTLTFVTENRPGCSVVDGDWYVIVTIPEDTQMERLEVSTVSGDIEDSGRTYQKAELSTTSGDIRLSDITADRVEADTISGAFIVSGSNFSDLEINSVSGAIELNGAFDQVDVESVSGNCTLAGTLNQKAAVETISGGIRISFPDISVDAASFGSIYKDDSRQGLTFSQVGGSADVKLESVSGKIEILSA